MLIFPPEKAPRLRPGSLGQLEAVTATLVGTARAVLQGRWSTWSISPTSAGSRPRTCGAGQCGSAAPELVGPTRAFAGHGRLLALEAQGR